MRSQPLEGASCEVETGAGKWTVTTPGSVQVGLPQGDLRVVCNKQGYRTSEVVFRRSGNPGVLSASGVGVGVGGGFGGSAIALIKADQIESVKEAIKKTYSDKGFKAPRFFTSLPSAGASARLID